MTETQKRIKELKRALPGIKEKVVAVAVLLALSVTMMASVSFAWYTMSFAPELSGVNTTVSSNGSLEIALSGSDGREPGTSLVGDSFAAENQTTHNANITWGNLINLSGNYGIENLILRPATFKAQAPAFLSSMKYGDDGRIEGTTTDFAFTTWMLMDEGTQLYNFSVAKETIFGVRAISSVGFDESMGKSIMLLKMEQAREALQKSTDKYESIFDGETTAGRKYVDVIRDVVNVYLNYYTYKALNDRGYASYAGILGVTNDSDITSLMPELIEIFEVFYDAVILYGDALDFLANVQTELGIATNKVNLGNAKTKYTTLEKSVLTDMNSLREFSDKEKHPTVTFDQNPEVLSIVNRLIDINSAIINGGGIDNKSVSSLMASMKEAISILMGLKNNTELTVLVTKGNLKTFEELHGIKRAMRLENLKLAGKTVHGTMSTNASGSLYEEAISKTQSLDTSYLNSMVAEDTYGMVIDLWFRTNSPTGTLLALDGLAKTETRYKDRMIILTGESKSRNVYFYERSTGVEMNGIALTEEVLVFRGEEGDANFEPGSYYDIYTYAKAYQGKIVQGEKLDEEGNPVLDENGDKILQDYVVDDENHPITDADVSIKRDPYEVVVGFESSNRYDGDYTYTEDGELSATQGTGSCFVFYADTPEESEAAKQMLRQMKLAFMDAENNLLAEAIMDVDHLFAEAGKYTVPIVITRTDATVTDESTGKTIYGITAMQQNVAKRISVVLYLEGEGLENSMAFSNGTINGSLNFQFTTSEDLNALKNTDLADKIITLSASMNKTNFDMYDGTVQTSTLTATVDGLNPKKVEAIFHRKINATQGSRMQAVTLTQQGGTNNWSAEIPFVLPGTYELSSLWIDGVEYSLPEKITVTMPGFAVTAVRFCETADEKVELTADGAVTRDVSVLFSSGQQPDKVEARFLGEDGNYVSATLMQDANGYWNGTANFTSSGTYTLKYVVISVLKPEPNPDYEYDVAYYELDDGVDENGEPDGSPNFQKTFTAFLGLRAEIKLNDSANNVKFEYYGPETRRITLRILTDNGTELRAMKNVKLYYGKRGSSVDTNGLISVLDWVNGVYSGEFNINKVGVFNFTKLEVDGNLITIASVAPSITAISLEPPEYLNSDATSNVIILSGDTAEKGYYVAEIGNADSASKILAQFVHAGSNNVIMVSAEKVEDGLYYFPIPYNNGTAENPYPTGGNRNGNWTVKELRFYEVYDEAGHYYGEGEGAYAEYYAQTPEFAFTVLDVFDVTVDQHQTLDNGAAFMTAQALSDTFGAKIGVSGVTLPDGLSVTNVILKLKHNGNSSAYGGYSFTGENALSTLTFSSQDGTLYQDAQGKWVISADAVVRLAGSYNYEVSFVVSGDMIAAETFTVSGGKVLEVKSVKPSVKVNSISTYGSSSKTDTSATVYFNESKNSTCGITTTNYSQPYVTLQLSGYGAATGAVLTFVEGSNGEVRLYSSNGGTTSINNFSWTSDGTCQRWVGYYKSVSAGNDQKNHAGTLTGNSLVMTYDGVNYTVDGVSITISNPS